MKQIAILITLASCLFTFSSSAQTWRNINTFNNKAIRGLSFIDSKVGYAFTGQIQTVAWELHKTTDAGDSWTKMSLNLPVVIQELMAIHFLDESNGFLVVRGKANQSAPYQGYVFQTVDGGSNWTDIGPSNMNLSIGRGAIRFFDTQRGVVSSGGSMYYTSNGGAQWTQPNLANSYWSTKEIDFIDPLHGIAGASDGTFAYKGIIFTTQNGGMTWDTLELGGQNTAIDRVDYTSNNTAFALGSYVFNSLQRIFKTTDNGSTWDTLALNFLKDSNDAAMDFHFVDHLNGYLLTREGYICITTDGGNSWVRDFYAGLNRGGLNQMESNGARIFAFGATDALLVLDQITGISPVTIEPSNRVFPNPCSIQGKLHFDQKISGFYQWIDASGKVLGAGYIEEQSTLNVADFHCAPGMYWLVVSGEQQWSQTIQLR